VKAFRDFEVEALRILLRAAVSPAQMDLIEEYSGAVEYDYTGCGYFIKISDPALPVERSTRHLPSVIGNSGDVLCGFVAFLGNHELVLECHTWGPVDVPPDFRERNVQISTPSATNVGRPDAT